MFEVEFEVQRAACSTQRLAYPFRLSQIKVGSFGQFYPPRSELVFSFQRSNCSATFEYLERTES